MRQMQGQLSNSMGDQCCYTLLGRMEVLIRSLYINAREMTCLICVFPIRQIRSGIWATSSNLLYILWESFMRYINKVICSRLLDEYNLISVVFFYFSSFSSLNFQFSFSMPTLFQASCSCCICLVKRDGHRKGYGVLIPHDFQTRYELGSEHLNMYRRKSCYSE